MHLRFDDLGLGFDLTALINTGTSAVSNVSGAINAPALAKRNAQIAKANAAAASQQAAAENARLQAILAGNAPRPIEWTKIALYAALAIGGSVVAVKALRAFKRRK